MKMISLLIVALLGIGSADLRAQTEVRKGVGQDTVVRTRRLQETTLSNPQGVAVRFEDVTTPSHYWNFELAYGMAFGDQTTFNFIPQFSYSRNVFFTVGGGINYIYYYLSHNRHKERMHYAGVNVFARLTPLPYLVFQVQPEILGSTCKENCHRVSGRFVHALLAGGGFTLPVGPGNITLLFLFDLIQNNYTPYGKNLYYTLGYSFPIR